MNEMPEHLPPVPGGYVYAGRLGDYPSDKTLRGICTGTLCHQDEWSVEVPWHGTDGDYFLTGAWHYAAPTNSDLGRKILAERSKPSWADAPDWAEWLAQDADGKWWCYGIEPKVYGREWAGRDPFFLLWGDPNPNFHTTLERRPESRIEQEGHGTTRGDADAKSEAIERMIEVTAHTPFDWVRLDGEPDLIIPKDAANELAANLYLEELVALGYRIEIDSTGIRGWKDE